MKKEHFHNCKHTGSCIFVTMVNNAAFTKRLSKILEEYELSAAAFADKVQVGRATISHLISGRNKPSLDFVLKVVQAFPEVDLYWLLLGTGSFPKMEREMSPILPSLKENVSEEAKADQEKTRLGIISSTIQTKNDINKDTTELPSSEKRIQRIVVLYKDGTFDSYEGAKV